jgi:hypothetical protein
MNRLYENGFIENSVGKTTSVVLTEKGLRESERLFKKLFGRNQARSESQQVKSDPEPAVTAGYFVRRSWNVVVVERGIDHSSGLLLVSNFARTSRP